MPCMLHACNVLLLPDISYPTHAIDVVCVGRMHHLHTFSSSYYRSSVKCEQNFHDVGISYNVNMSFMTFR